MLEYAAPYLSLDWRVATIDLFKKYLEALANRDEIHADEIRQLLAARDIQIESPTSRVIQQPPHLCQCAACHQRRTNAR
jgi:hypothetical protein